MGPKPYRYLSNMYIITKMVTVIPTYLGTELNLSNILSFLKARGFSAAHARSLGIHLLVPIATIKTLKKDNVDDAEGLLIDIIVSWLNQTEPSWEELAGALYKCNYQRIARECEFKLSVYGGFNEVIYNMQWTHL